MALYRKLLATNAPAAVILIRVLVGWVFLSEGIQKFLDPAALGAGRFAKIGIPAPEFFGPFVGVVKSCAGRWCWLGCSRDWRPWCCSSILPSPSSRPSCPCCWDMKFGDSPCRSCRNTECGACCTRLEPIFRCSWAWYFCWCWERGLGRWTRGFRWQMRVIDDSDANGRENVEGRAIFGLATSRMPDVPHGLERQARSLKRWRCSSRYWRPGRGQGNPVRFSASAAVYLVLAFGLLAMIISSVILAF